MILVDTSVWVRGLKGKETYRAELDRLLRDGAVGGHELVHGELLAGDNGGREGLLREYRRLPWAERRPHDDVVAWVRKHRLCGRGVGWVDLHLLASAHASRCQLWTADTVLTVLARELDLAWQPSR